MGVGMLISLEEYLSTTYRPGCDFIEGHAVERNVGNMPLVEVLLP